MSWADRFKSANQQAEADAAVTGRQVFVGAGVLNPSSSSPAPVAPAAAPAVEAVNAGAIPESPEAPAAPAAAAAPAPAAVVELTDVVLDAGAIISGEVAKLARPGVRYYTVAEVLAEIKDAVSRAALQAFPYRIQVVQVEEDSLAFVRQFAGLTGDLRQLSAPDLQILALGVQLERARNAGGSSLRERPLTDHQAELKVLLAQQEADQADQPAAAAAAEEDAHKQQPQPEQPISPPAVVQEQPQQEQVVEAAAAAADAGNDDAQAEEEDDDDANWITPENVDAVDPQASFKAGRTERTETELNQAGAAGGAEAFRKNSPVAVATTDFTMQNVMLQMGLRLLSVQGKEITGIRRWVLKCFCCGHTELRNLERQFCDWCGHHTLARAVVEVQPDGRVQVWENHRFIYNLRGTKYPIPKPRGGRWAQDLKFAEDVIDERRLHEHKKHRKDVESLFQLGSDFGNPGKRQVEADVYGYGRRNPNRRQKTTGNKKRGKR